MGDRTALFGVNGASACNGAARDSWIPVRPVVSRLSVSRGSALAGRVRVFADDFAVDFVEGFRQGRA